MKKAITFLILITCCFIITNCKESKKTTSYILITNSGKTIKLTPSQYAKYKVKPGDEFEFVGFNKVQNSNEKKPFSSKFFKKNKKSASNSFRDYCRRNGCFDISNSWLNSFTFDVNSARGKVRRQKKITMELIDFNWSTLKGSSTIPNSQYDDVNGIAMGMNNDSEIEIYINENYWRSASDKEKKLLIYHELGHDILNLKHSSDPCHFMYPNVGSSCQFKNLSSDLWDL